MIEQDIPPQKTSNRFLDLAQSGRNEWWRYLLGTALIFIIWQVIGTLFLIPLAIYVALIDPNLLASFDQVANIYPFFWMVSVFLTFIMLWIPTWAITLWLHRRPFKSLFTAAPTMRWSRIAQGFAIYGVLVLVATLVEGFLIHPDNYVWVYDPSSFWWFALAISLLVPIQATAEEILFRGYILQATGFLSRNLFILSLINGILFMLPHLLNEEVQVSPILVSLGFIISGIFFAIITLLDNGMELAIGAHIANNIFALAFVNLTDSSIVTSPLFLVTELDPIYNLISQTIAGLLFILIIFRPFSTKSQSL